MRIQSWPQALDEYIESCRSTHFQYGRFDCAIFTAGAIRVITGTDLMEGFPFYDSKTSAYRLIKKHGSTEKMISALLPNSRQIAPALAGRGDVVTLNLDLESGEHGPSIGICVGVKFVTTALAGIVFSDISRVASAWRIE